MTNVHTVDSTSPIRVREDAVIAQAKAILDQQLSTRGRGFNSSDNVCSYPKLKLAPEPNEAFAVIYVDTPFRVITFEILQYGTIEGLFSPRHVAERYLKHNATAVIVGHNPHPVIMNLAKTIRASPDTCETR